MRSVSLLLQIFLLVPATSTWVFDFSAHQAALVDFPEADMTDQSSSSGLIISDVLGRERSTNVFSGIVRDVPSVSERFQAKDKNCTVLAPSNGKMMDLPRKPWEAQSDYSALGANAYEGENGEGRAQKNLLRFAEAHIVPESPWKANEKVSTLNGKIVWYEEVDGKRIIKPDNVDVIRIADTVSNGQVWVINGVLDYA